MWTQQPRPWLPTFYTEIAGAQQVTDKFCTRVTNRAMRMLSREMGVQVGGVVFQSQDQGVFLSPNDSCPLLPRVLESLLVSLVTTVVVFVASMVLGECRQMSSGQIGNDSFLLQVCPAPRHLCSASAGRVQGWTACLARAHECAGLIAPRLASVLREGCVEAFSLREGVHLCLFHFCE